MCVCQGERVELYMTHQELGHYTYNINFTAETKPALMNSLHPASLKTYALISFSEVHYLSSSILIYLFAHLARVSSDGARCSVAENKHKGAFGRTVNITVSTRLW